MKECKIKVNFTTGEIQHQPINLVQNDYNSTKFVFEYDQDYSDYIITLQILFPDNKVYITEIINGEFVVKNPDSEDIASLISQVGRYSFNLSLYKIDSKLTTTDTSSFYVKGDISDNESEEIDTKLPILDDLINQVNEALIETNNINIDIDDDCNVTITKKDGSSKIQNVKGQSGIDGKDATINGRTTIEIEAGENVVIEQEEDKLIISSTGGGEGGTSNYEDLENKPKINNVELNGNKSLEDLGIDQDFVKDNNYVHTDNNFTENEKTKLAGLENYDDTGIREYIDEIVGNIETLLSEV